MESTVHIPWRPASFTCPGWTLVAAPVGVGVAITSVVIAGVGRSDQLPDCFPLENAELDFLAFCLESCLRNTFFNKLLLLLIV